MNRVLDDQTNWEFQKKMTKITTIELILRHRFPTMRLGFLHLCEINELDEIIENISTISEDDLLKYHHEND